MEVKYEVLPKSELEILKPMWEKLNSIHQQDSVYFKDHFENFSFGRRMEKLEDLEEECIRIEVVTKKGKPVAYCLSTVQGETGEIDSLFIEEECRKAGIGSSLVMRSIGWFDRIGCTKTVVSVAHGHEGVCEFYRKFGFFPRLLTLERKLPI